jgi:hypothetical protein
MTMDPSKAKKGALKVPELTIPGGADPGSKWLIAAVLAAGKDGCNCDSCQLLKKFGGAMSAALLKEEASSGD